MALKDFTYEMVVPNEDLPCKFFIFNTESDTFSQNTVLNQANI